MIFNATRLNLHTRDKTLVVRAPLRAIAAEVRKLVVTREISDLLDGKIATGGFGFPHGKADALIARYIAGYLVCVSLIGTSKPEVDLERLSNEDEIWMLCIREPRPGWRVFGRFLEKDKFIGLRAYDRHDLPTKEVFHSEALATVEDWNAIVSMAPHRGTKVGDYLSGVWRDVDEHE